MNDILHANIFFFISSVATVLIAVLILIILFYIARIVRDVSDIVRKINGVSADLERDFQDVRREVKNEGVKIRAMVDVVLGFGLSQLKKRTARKTKAKTEIEFDPVEEDLQ